jgi:uncharacterized membrane protein
MPWAAVIAAGATLASAAISSRSASRAANQQADAAASANALQKYMYDQTRTDQAPWRAAGENALTKLTRLLNNGQLTSRFAGKLDNEPGYQFALKEGQRAIDNSASARGGVGGAALKAGARFAEDNANKFYGDAFNRYQAENLNTYNMLSGTAGLGQVANAANQAAGANYANQYGQNTIGNANAQGAASIGLGNIYGNALNQFVAQGNNANWWQNPQQGSSFGPALDQFFNGTGTSGD